MKSDFLINCTQHSSKVLHSPWYSMWNKLHRNKQASGSASVGSGQWTGPAGSAGVYTHHLHSLGYYRWLLSCAGSKLVLEFSLRLRLDDSRWKQTTPPARLGVYRNPHCLPDRHSNFLVFRCSLQQTGV